tara:strand:+ start:602 stop:931 length:330 start_codon:yes stop_codon:yes gene_type:complete
VEEIPDNAKIAEGDLMMAVIVTVSASTTAKETAMMTLEGAAEAQEEITEAVVKGKEREAILIVREEVSLDSTEITDHQKALAEAEDVVATISVSREIITLEDEVTITAS